MVDVQRLSLPGLMGGLEDAVSPADAHKLLVPAFVCGDVEYYVENRRFGIWRVAKLVGDGAEEYVVRQERAGLTCDCFSGRRHLACRHKAMVMTLVGQPMKDDHGTRGKDARVTRVSSMAKPVVPTPRGDVAGSRALLERVQTLLKRVS